MKGKARTAQVRVWFSGIGYFIGFRFYTQGDVRNEGEGLTSHPHPLRRQRQDEQVISPDGSGNRLV